MLHDLIDGTCRQAKISGDSNNIWRLRKLRPTEVELMRHREQLAALRRAFPQGPFIPTHCSSHTKKSALKEL
jgi:hypothetical protein